MKRGSYPEKEYLQQCLEYKDGRMHWIARPRNHFRSENSYRKFNVQYTGKEAGYKTKYVIGGKEYWRWIIKINNKRYLRSCLVWILLGDELLTSDKHVDHKNHDTLDDKIENLRLCSNYQNMQNRRTKRGSKSNLKGVCWSGEREKFYSKIRVGGKTIRLGFFDTDIEAHAAYKEAALKYHGDYACFE